MAVLERELYRTTRGPTPSDEESWHLVFDPDTKRLVVRHEWTTAGHSGVAEFDVAEFLKQDGGEQAVRELIRLIGGLFKVPAYA
jgi:hypothetical protein